MPKRFHDTEIWTQDWFIALPADYQKLYLYVKDDCDHAGIWRPNIMTFNKVFDCQCKLDVALRLFNEDREKDDPRVIVLPKGRWFLPHFIPFQYGKVLNLESKAHKSVFALLLVYEVNLTSIRPQIEVKHSLKDKDKDKDKDNKTRSGLSDIDFFSHLKKTYDYIDLDTELKKMDAWLLNNPQRKKTRRFIVAWLNRIDKPMAISQKRGGAYATPL